MSIFKNRFFSSDGEINHYLEKNKHGNAFSGESGEFLTTETLDRAARKEFIRSPLNKKFLKNVALTGFLVILLLFSRTAFLQIIQGESYRSLAEGNRLRVRTIIAERGIITDRLGRILTRNVPTFSISVSPRDLPQTHAERERVLNTLAELVGTQTEEIKIILSDFVDSSLVIPIKENLSYQNALLAEIKIATLPGVSIDRATRRYYSVEEENILSLSHVLGYEGKITKEEYAKKIGTGYLRTDRIGKSGIELSYESFLRGVLGKEKTEVDALGHKKRIIAKDDPTPGKNIVLSINLDAQKKLEDSVKNIFRQTGASRAVAIALDPRNGEILAFVNLPAFSSNDFSFGINSKKYESLLDNPEKPLFFRGISGEYPSGSTIKPFIAAAALDEGVITPQTIVRSAGGIRIGEWFFPDWLPGGHGDVNVIKAIAQSVNTFFYYIGGGYQGFKGLGVNKIVEHALRFGFGEKLGIDVNGETNGLLPTEEWKKKIKNEEWYIGDTYHLSIGQGDILVTPLQVAVATAAIANGGTVWQPHLVYEYINPDGSEEKINPLALKSEAAKKESIAVVSRAMREAVLTGSARLLSTIPVSSAGKTGTAEWRNGSKLHAWFTGFAPLENPEIVITVLVEEGGEGSVAAVPVARDFLQWYFNKKTKN